MYTATARLSLPFAGGRARCRRLIVAVLFAATVLGGSATHVAFAQTAPPGPLLGTGDFITTDNRVATATWEAYAGGMLLIWDTTYVSRAIVFPCAIGGTAVCYKWIQYIYDLSDPYDSELWTPFQRGCMTLGADPLTVGEADGLSRVSDIYAAGETYIGVNRPNEGDGTLNPAATGLAPAPSVSALQEPWIYDHGCGAGGLGTGGGSCSDTYIGTWNGNSHTRTDTVTLTEGPVPTVVITAGPLVPDEADFLANASGSWNVYFTGNSPFSVVQSSVTPIVHGDTLTVTATISGPANPAPSAFALHVGEQSPDGTWDLDTCTITIP